MQKLGVIDDQYFELKYIEKVLGFKIYEIES